MCVEDTPLGADSASLLSKADVKCAVSVWGCLEPEGREPAKGPFQKEAKSWCCVFAESPTGKE